jgi:hypothetical protein
MLRNEVSEETYHRLTTAGWTLPRPDAQELFDQLPEGSSVWKAIGSGVMNSPKPCNAGIINGLFDIEVQYGETASEALAALWLKIND